MPPDKKKKKPKIYEDGTEARFFFAPAKNPIDEKDWSFLNSGF